LNALKRAAAAAAAAAAVCCAVAVLPLHILLRACTFENWPFRFAAFAVESIRGEKMISTRRHKPAAAEAFDPLGDVGILKYIFAFLPGLYLFVGAVCREWNVVYAGTEEQDVFCLSVNGSRDFWQSYGPKSTLFSAAVASPATIRLIYDCELHLYAEDVQLQLVAGLHADLQSLAALRELGMPLSKTVVKAVALSGRLNILQHLLSDHQCVRPNTLSHIAARSGSISMLKWLRAEGWCVFDHVTCVGAAHDGQLAALQHLRSEGCDWNAESIAYHAAASGSIEMMEWLRQQQGIEIDASVIAGAAGFGQIAMCEHLCSTGCDWDTSTC
jgi:hypothetical protein